MFGLVECTGCFCGSDEANRLVCTETNLEIGYSEKERECAIVTFGGSSHFRAGVELL